MSRALRDPDLWAKISGDQKPLRRQAFRLVRKGCDKVLWPNAIYDRISDCASIKLAKIAPKWPDM